METLFPKGVQVAYTNADDGVAGVVAEIYGYSPVTARGRGVTEAHALAALFEELFTDLDQMQVADADGLLTYAGKTELAAIRRLVHGDPAGLPDSVLAAMRKAREAGPLSPAEIADLDNIQGRRVDGR